MSFDMARLLWRAHTGLSNAHAAAAAMPGGPLFHTTGSIGSHRSNGMKAPHDILLAKLRRHSALSDAEAQLLRGIPIRARQLQPDQDLVREHEKPHVSAVVLNGLVARYHTLSGGRRQYLSVHIAGDWPDAQTLFLGAMDHSICAIGKAEVGILHHEQLMGLFARHPAIGFAIWRETLIDAALFREAITNNSSRSTRTRMAHFFCELYFRARAAGLIVDGALALPMKQEQIGEMLGMALVTVNRTIKQLRATGTVDFRGGALTVRNADELAVLAEFDPTYLHLEPLT
jgi:CRP-like cAMP-binding protein